MKGCRCKLLGPLLLLLLLLQNHQDIVYQILYKAFKQSDMSFSKEIDWWIDWSIVVLRSAPEHFRRRDVIVIGEGLHNLGLCLAVYDFWQGKDPNDVMPAMTASISDLLRQARITPGIQKTQISIFFAVRSIQNNWNLPVFVKRWRTHGSQQVKSFEHTCII